jgi:hypothetical protein
MPETGPPVIESDFTSRLGETVIRWSVLEEWLSHLLATSIDADLGGMSVITSSAGAATQIKWIETIIAVYEHKDSRLKEITELVKRADELRTDRNAHVHGVWDQTNCEKGTCSVQTYNWKRSEIIKEWLITPADLDELISGIDEWLADFVRLGRKLNFPRRRGETESIFLD